MAIRIVQHTQFNWDADFPTPARPVTMSGRDLATDAVMLPHHHPWGQLTYAMEGVLRLTVNRSSWILPPLRAIWVAPDVVHEVTVLEAARLRPLCVHPSRVPFPGPECRVLEVSSLLRELMAALEQHDEHDASERGALLTGLILDELPRCPTRPLRVPLPADKRLNALCQALMADPGAELSLRDWAQQVGASERTLARLFERELGMGFAQWRQQVRLAHAAPLIARGTPLSQVAQELGYASQSAFSAMFKKTFGCSPSAFFA